eukprot:COSAG05_NODE_2497_length_2982_cov_2.345127_2_plen_687_part_00
MSTLEQQSEQAAEAATAKLSEKLDAEATAWQQRVDEAKRELEVAHEDLAVSQQEVEQQKAETENERNKRREDMLKGQENVQRLEAALAQKETERKEQTRRIADMAQTLQQVQEQAQAQVATARQHAEEIKVRFEAEHEKWVGKLKSERETWEKSLQENKAALATQMAEREREGRARAQAKADQLRREHAMLAADLSRKMGQAVDDARTIVSQGTPSTMSAISARTDRSFTSSVAGGGPGSPARRLDMGSPRAMSELSGSGPSSPASVAAAAGALADDQLERLRGVWQSQMEQEKARWQAQLAAGKEHTERTSRKLKVATDELQETQDALATTRATLQATRKKVEEATAAVATASNRESRRTLEMAALKQSAEEAQVRQTQQLEEEKQAAASQAAVSMAQIDALRIEIGQVAAALEEAQTEVMKAREAQFDEKRRVQELERELTSKQGSAMVQEELESAQAQVTKLRRELLAARSAVETAQVDASEAAAAVAQRDAKIEKLLAAAQQDEKLREQLRREHAAHAERNYGKVLEEKGLQIQALKNSIERVTAQLEASQGEVVKAKQDILPLERRAKEAESKLAQGQLREEQLHQAVEQAEEQVEEKREELADLKERMAQESEGARRVEKTLEKELGKVTSARDEALAELAALQSKSSTSAVKTEESLISLRAQVHARPAAENGAAFVGQ